jgi:hypothetical protein
MALKKVLEAFGNDLGAFQEGLGKFKILRETLAYIPALDGGGIGTRAIAPPGTGSIVLFNSTFYHRDQQARLQWRSTDDILFTIFHEIGHIFDFRFAVGTADPQLYRSTYFAESFGARDSAGNPCKAGWLGCRGDRYNPSGTTSTYGKTSSLEDFAESFAAFVVDKSGGTSPIVVGPERLTYFEIGIAD